MINISSIREKCASEPMESTRSIKMQQEFYKLCDFYLKVLENDICFCKLMTNTSDFFKDLGTFRPQMSRRENLNIMQCWLKFIKLPIGFAKLHRPSYVVIDKGKRVELRFEVITFSAYNRLIELGYNVTDFGGFTIFNFLALKEAYFFGITEIHQTSIFKDPSQLHVIKHLNQNNH